MVPMLAERGLLSIAPRMKTYFIKLPFIITNEYKFPLFIEIEGTYYSSCYYSLLIKIIIIKSYYLPGIMLGAWFNLGCRLVGENVMMIEK